VIGAAKSAAGLAAGLGIVMVTTAVLLGVVLTSVELRDGINRD